MIHRLAIQSHAMSSSAFGRQQLSNLSFFNLIFIMKQVWPKKWSSITRKAVWRTNVQIVSLQLFPVSEILWLSSLQVHISYIVLFNSCMFGDTHLRVLSFDVYDWNTKIHCKYSTGVVTPLRWWKDSNGSATFLKSPAQSKQALGLMTNYSVFVISSATSSYSKVYWSLLLKRGQNI